MLDLGRHAPVRGSKVFAALKGVVDAGVWVPHGEEIFPDEERLDGTFLEQKKDFDAVRAAISGTDGAAEAASAPSGDGAQAPVGNPAAKSTDDEEE